VLDEAGTFASHCNAAMVDLEPVLPEAEQRHRISPDEWHLQEADETLLTRLIENPARFTSSKRARLILDDWSAYRPRFVKVFPKEYRRALAEIAAANRRNVA